MGGGGYFTDERRKKIRQKTGVGFLEDYFLRSEITDYRRLRVLLNLLIGIVFCSFLYYFGWKKLNFADFHVVYGLVFKWFMILSTACAFALSPMFRCAMLCVLFGALGKNGQAPLSLLILHNLNEGPITNIVSNFQRTAEILLCHLELQAKIATNRVSMLTEPVEAVLEKQLGKYCIIYVITLPIMTPFMAELKASRTKEDKKMEDRDAQLNVWRTLFLIELLTTFQLHMMLVEMPRIENVFQVSQLKMAVSIGTNYVKARSTVTVSQVLQALFIFYVYVIFRDAVNMIENYRTDVNFNNHFITGLFWQIDHHRELLGQQAIRHISKEEMRSWRLMNVSLVIKVTMTNSHCLLPPQRPDFGHIFAWIIIPLVISLLIQVIFSFVVRRIIINYFMPFMFPLRDRVRIIFLYNKNLFLVETITNLPFSGWLSYQSWFKRNILDRLFRTGQCLMCQVGEF
ncbi:unnamed protein product [Haemonchus placei]|uniref:DC_STAMP domain-containing protein n=1 Tax=Haemonchus placei TaxID=6290 RepID=A0A0N4W364_HAEPC|nr:unnamed protein product [Haemonchus placei]